MTRSAKEKQEILENEFDIIFNDKESEDKEEMCNLNYGIEQRGIIKGKLELIRDLQKSMNITFIEAMNLLKISKESQKEFIEYLEKYY